MYIAMAQRCIGHCFRSGIVDACEHSKRIQDHRDVDSAQEPEQKALLRAGISCRFRRRLITSSRFPTTKLNGADERIADRIATTKLVVTVSLYL